MRTLSSTLLATQKQATRTPYLKVEVRQKVGAATRLDFQRIYEGSELDWLHAATSPGDGSLIRARLNPSSSGDWVSPTGYSDPNNGWNNETKAYDEDTNTYANSNDIPAASWSQYLILTIAATYCDRVRFNAAYSTYINQIDLDVYWGGAWHDIYQGPYSDHAWVEKQLGGTYSVTQARVRFYNSHSSDPRWATLYEFDFGQSLEPTYLYRQRVVNPGPGSDFSQWTYITNVGWTGGTALASSGAKAIHFWTHTDYKTIKYQESSDYGASWGSVQTLITPTNAVYHLAAAMKPNGDVCLFYFEGSAIKAIKRISSVWGSPQTWPNSLNQVSGIGSAYYQDWNFVVSGRDLSDRRGVWSCIYGDGGQVAVGSWSALKDILLAEIDSNTDYNCPSLAYDGTIHRLTLIEVFAATQTYSRPYLSFQTPQSTYLDNLWREPYPFNLSCDYSLAIAISPTKALLTRPDGVWEATLNPTPLDLTPDVLSLQQRIAPIAGSPPGRLTLELDNSQGQYADFSKKGCELLVSPGYQTTEGNEYSSGPSFWIQAWEHISVPRSHLPGSTLVLYATDAWGLLEGWRARRQLTWAADTSTVKEILIYLLARVGIPLTVQTQSSLITTLKPAFTVHPGESGASAIKRLLGMVPDVLFFREATAYLKNPQTSDATDYAYYLVPAADQHPFLQGRYRLEAMNTNRVQVWGTQTPHIMVDRFNWDDLEDCYDRLHQVHDLNINTVSLAEQRADALLREAEISSKDGEAIAPMNCGQELWDVIEITDPRANLNAQKYRLRALEIDYSVSKPKYRLKLILGTL